MGGKPRAKKVWPSGEPIVKTVWLPSGRTKKTRREISSDLINDARIYWDGIKVFIVEHGYTVEAVWDNLFSDLDEYPELDADARIQWTTGWFSAAAQAHNMDPEEFLKKYVL